MLKRAGLTALVIAAILLGFGEATCDASPPAWLPSFIAAAVVRIVLALRFLAGAGEVSIGAETCC